MCGSERKRGRRGEVPGRERAFRCSRRPAAQPPLPRHLFLNCRPVTELSDGVVLGQLAPGDAAGADRLTQLLTAVLGSSGAEGEQALNEFEVRLAACFPLFKLGIHALSANACRRYKLPHSTRPPISDERQQP